MYGYLQYPGLHGTSTACSDYSPFLVWGWGGFGLVGLVSWGLGGAGLFCLVFGFVLGFCDA